MEPADIASVIVNGQVVYYKRGEVIAIGEAARDFVLDQGGAFSAGERSGLSRNVTVEGGDEPVSVRPKSYRISGLGARALAVVEDARARGLRVGPNHVLTAHCGCRCQCDPCCGGQLADRSRANPYWANPYWANPYWANPYWANALVRTSAVRATPRVLGGAPMDPDNIPERSSGVTVWIIDTGLTKDAFVSPLDNRGINGEKEDEPDRIVAPSDGLVDPVAGHGTFIAGIVEELAPGCVINVRSVIEPSGFLEERDVETEIYSLLATGGDRTRTILNLSFGGGLYDPFDPAVADAIAAAQEAGVVVVASAGNGMSCIPVYPANFPGVVAVGAVDRHGQPANFTNIGSWVQACALGVDVTSTFFVFAEDANTVEVPAEDPLKTFEGWAVWSGSSFAAPVVVAAIAQELIGGSATANDAVAAALGKGVPIPCLGSWVNPTRVDRLVEEARPAPSPS